MDAHFFQMPRRFVHVSPINISQCKVCTYFSYALHHVSILMYKYRFHYRKRLPKRVHNAQPSNENSRYVSLELRHSYDSPEVVVPYSITCRFFQLVLSRYSMKIMIEFWRGHHKVVSVFRRQANLPMKIS